MVAGNALNGLPPYLQNGALSNVFLIYVHRLPSAVVGGRYALQFLDVNPGVERFLFSHKRRESKLKRDDRTRDTVSGRYLSCMA